MVLSLHFELFSSVSQSPSVLGVLGVQCRAVVERKRGTQCCRYGPAIASTTSGSPSVPLAIWCAAQGCCGVYSVIVLGLVLFENR